MKFDVVFSNPPYNSNIDIKILNEIIDVADEFVIVHPSTWVLDLKDKSKLYQDFKTKLNKNINKFDLVFIDGEHTDYGCFRDFIYSQKYLKENSVVMFHDSTLVYKSLKIIQEYLTCNNIVYKFIKIQNSSVSFIFFGNYISLSCISRRHNFQKGVEIVEKTVLKMILNLNLN